MSRKLAIDTNSYNVYENILDVERVLDLSNRELESVPEDLVEKKTLYVLYLKNNRITSLRDDFFPSFSNLKWLDLRDNCLTDIPTSIQDHPNLTHLLLQNNKLKSLPNELGTVKSLKVLHIDGNPINYPPSEILKSGVAKILQFLRDKLIESFASTSCCSDVSFEGISVNYCEPYNEAVLSYNSVLDNNIRNKPLTVRFNEKNSDNEDDLYTKNIAKCPRLPKSRKKPLPSYYQSARYLKPVLVDSQSSNTDKLKEVYLKEKAMKKRKELLKARDKIIQDRKNLELLKNWRNQYRYKQVTNCDGSFRLEAKHYPYDTNPEYMTLLSREDIEKDLPDKYRKKLLRKSKPTVRRKNPNDVHLAMKIKQLFENLEKIDLKRDDISPRTEQKMLMGEIHKITEIKQKLAELSIANERSVSGE